MFVLMSLSHSFFLCFFSCWAYRFFDIPLSKSHSEEDWTGKSILAPQGHIRCLIFRKSSVLKGRCHNKIPRLFSRVATERYPSPCPFPLNKHRICTRICAGQLRILRNWNFYPLVRIRDKLYGSSALKIFLFEIEFWIIWTNCRTWPSVFPTKPAALIEFDSKK